MVQYLKEEAKRLHVHVKVAKLAISRRGFYSPAKNTIYINRSLTQDQRREALAHELAHCFYGHDCTSELNERQADNRAALMLIDPDLYRRAALINPHPNYVAIELGLTSHIVEVWQEHWLPQLAAKHREFEDVA